LMRRKKYFVAIFSLSTDPRLTMRAHLSRSKGAGTHDLMHLPFKQFEGGESRRCVGIARREFFRFVSVCGANYVDTVFTIAGRTGKKNFSSFVLLLHPDEMLIQCDRPLLPRLYRPAQN
jgi:hypothetical protein